MLVRRFFQAEKEREEEMSEEGRKGRRGSMSEGGRDGPCGAKRQQLNMKLGLPGTEDS